MGLRALVFELLNCGALPYRVKGHPAVRLLGPDRTPLSAEIIEGRSAVTVLPPVDAAPAMVTLRPGERAEAVLVWRTTAIPGPADRATYFEVTARAGDEPQIVDPVRQLDIGTGGRLGIGPWARRAAG